MKALRTVTSNITSTVTSAIATALVSVVSGVNGVIVVLRSITIDALRRIIIKPSSLVD